MASWADRTPAVSALILIGSRVRQPDDVVWRADAQSDWDFQIITSKPFLFRESSWTKEIPEIELRAYSVRTTIIGGVPKVNAVFSDTEADFVIIPKMSVILLRLLMVLGLHRSEGKVQRYVQDLAEVIRPGWRFLKGSKQWGEFYQRAVDEVKDPRLSNDDACRLADGFACDYVWTLRKIARGELRTAQRALFRELLEVDLQLFHELKQRRGERSFTKGRRLELISSGNELDSLSFECSLDSHKLLIAIEKSAATCRDLMKALVGDAWQWPKLGH